MDSLTWRDEWYAISARIEGLVKAGELFYKSIEKHSEDSFGAIRKVLFPEGEALFYLLVDFRKNHEKHLPKQAIDSLDKFASDFRANFTKNVGSATFTLQLQIVQIRLTSLVSLRSELEYYLSNISDQIRRTAQRAFVHMQRCIIADTSYQERWKSAYKRGEVECEKLGAIHLLWHGIWAFKVGAKGGRTDLVIGDKIDNPSQVEDAFGLILTEWKRADPDSEYPKKFDEARIQASKYSTGVLGGIELLSPRYLIVVTNDYIKTPPDSEDGDITYKHVNIAVKPSVPSAISRKVS